MEISIIAAVAQNNVIGNNNSLIWHLPADLLHFKTLTLGHTIIMGRKTYLSIGQALPKRNNIVISHNPNFKAPNCTICHSLNEAINLAQAQDIQEVFICGGSQIYHQALNIATKMYLTLIHHSFEGDTFFPSFDTKQWLLIERQDLNADDKNAYSLSFVTYNKNSNNLG